jgi:SpoVK/Ycf46/Vps4 family AAA+-type ATPase
MKQPSRVGKPGRAASKPGVGLSAKELAQIRAIAAKAHLRTGSGRKALLFSGAHAAAAAKAMAKQLRRDLLSVDLSAIISKYIGETEKNLERLFADAEASGAVLIFDEADALFGKRTEVKDSHDRYSNIEIDYLLQRIKQHGGLVVLASKPRFVLSMSLRRRISVYDFPPP